MQKIKHMAPGLLLISKNISVQENDEFSMKEGLREQNGWINMDGLTSWAMFS